MTLPLAALPLLVLLLKVTALLLAGLGASLLLQRSSAGSRHLVWLVVLGALLLLPALAVWAPLPLRVLPAELAPAPGPDPLIPSAAASAAAPAAPSAAAAAAPLTPSPEQPAATLPDPGAVLLGLWCLVALAFAGRLVYGAWSVRRIVRHARPLQAADWQTPLYEIADRLGLEEAPRLLQSDAVKMPFAAGVLSASIVLPVESETWSPERRRAVLVHELGHVRRRDLIGHTLSRVACALYWFHPLVWTAARRLRAESERACDDLALVFGARPSEYAEHLLDIVTCVRDHNTPAVALAMAHRREFEGRMLAILNPDLSRRAPGRLATASLAGSLALLAVLLGAAAPSPRLAPSPVALDPVLNDQAAVTGIDSAPAVRQPVHRPSPPAAPGRAATGVGAPASAVTGAPAAMQDSSGDRITALAHTLGSDSIARVRRVAAWGLRRFADSAIAVQALTAALAGDADASVREMSAWALADARSGSAAPLALARAVRQDRDPKVRATAIWAIGSIGNPAVMDAVTGALADTTPRVRDLAAWAIGSCGPQHAPAALVRALGDKNRDVRLSVAWALYRIGDPETAPAIDAAFRVEKDHDVQIGLIRALGAMGDRAVSVLEGLVSSPDTEIRTMAVTALAGGRAGGPWPWPRPKPRPYP